MTMDSSSSNGSTKLPTLPALYFHQEPSSSQTETLLDSSNAFHCAMPAEVFQLCLVEYSNWGDLAKLACVQSSWKNLVSDAAHTSPQAMWVLAQALLRGNSGLEANPELALRYLFQLANMELDETTQYPLRENIHNNKQNNINNNNNNNTKPFVPAMREIAQLYLEGADGIPADSAKGVAWLQASHNDGGDNDAAYQLALIYEYGRHEIAIDVYAAFEWFQKSASTGHVEAMAELALCYELGCGVEQSDEHALDWYMKAARSGHATAKYSVGEAFEEARGVPQSDEEACLWYYKAALDGDEDSKQALMRLQDIARIVVPGVGRLLAA